MLKYFEMFSTNNGVEKLKDSFAKTLEKSNQNLWKKINFIFN